MHTYGYIYLNICIMNVYKIKYFLNNILRYMAKKDLLIKYHSHDYTPLIKTSSHKKQKFK